MCCWKSGDVSSSTKHFCSFTEKQRHSILWKKLKYIETWKSSRKPVYVFWKIKLHSTFHRDGIGFIMTEFFIFGRNPSCFPAKVSENLIRCFMSFSETINSSKSGCFFSDCPKKKFNSFSVEKRTGISRTPNRTPGLGKRLFYDVLIREVKDRITYILHHTDHWKEGAIAKATMCFRTTAQKSPDKQVNDIISPQYKALMT